jgi:hypothetical protein
MISRVQDAVISILNLRAISAPRLHPILSRANIIADRRYAYDPITMRLLIIPPLFSTIAWAVATYDYVIVGGGTSGLVVANRLTEHSSSTLIVSIFYKIETDTNRL